VARDENKIARVEYDRLGEVVHFKLENVDEHELRALIVALWLIHEPTSRLDIIRELAHYHEAPDALPPLVSMAIAKAYRKARS
jgi:hypothetical protein